jgi:hypothetical protein
MYIHVMIWQRKLAREGWFFQDRLDLLLIPVQCTANHYIVLWSHSMVVSCRNDRTRRSLNVVLVQSIRMTNDQAVLLNYLCSFIILDNQLMSCWSQLKFVRPSFSMYYSWFSHSYLLTITMHDWNDSLFLCMKLDSSTWKYWLERRSKQ